MWLSSQPMQITPTVLTKQPVDAVAEQHHVFRQGTAFLMQGIQGFGDDLGRQAGDAKQNVLMVRVVFHGGDFALVFCRLLGLTSLSRLASLLRFAQSTSSVSIV